jgi:hypothetical protein
MSEPRTRFDAAELIARLKVNIASIEQVIAGNRRIHPERMTEPDWRDMRTLYISSLETQISLIRAQIALLEREARHERRNSQSDY